MKPAKKKHADVKSKLHPRNIHNTRYDFKLLIEAHPELEQYVFHNKFSDLSVDFFNPEAVKALNTAILKKYYGLQSWDIPEGYLCPPIPGRADYIHHIADLLYRERPEVIGTKRQLKNNIRVLDIGTGANCIYPIIGSALYGWQFVGSEIEQAAIQSAKAIVEANNNLKDKLEIREQSNSEAMFEGIIGKEEFFDLSICNPPFHASAEEAIEGTVRKLRRLKGEKVKQPVLNFGGQSNELWCEGGEEKFIHSMVDQSKAYGKQVFWFSTLVSKRSLINSLVEYVKAAGCYELKTINMGQGNKTSRILAWTFLDKEQQARWQKVRWS